MKTNKSVVRSYIISGLAISMIMTLWVFLTDALVFDYWVLIAVVLPIMLYAFVFCLVQYFIARYLESRPVLCILAEYTAIVILFLLFGSRFGWYPNGMEWLCFVYTIPVYALSYFLRLAGAKKNAAYINKRLNELNANKKEQEKRIL